MPRARAAQEADLAATQAATVPNDFHSPRSRTQNRTNLPTHSPRRPHNYHYSTCFADLTGRYHNYTAVTRKNMRKRTERHMRCHTTPFYFLFLMLFAPI